MTNPTHASTAAPDPGTQKTSGTAIATTASSTIPQRIDDFIKSRLSEANSADGSGISDSADRAARLGFANSSNVRYSAFLEAFRSSPHLTATYQERYPNSLFLPWPALHAVIKSLDLWLDLPEHYRGAVPEAQLPWMEIFELERDDWPAAKDVRGMLPTVADIGLRRLEQVINGDIRFGVPFGVNTGMAPFNVQQEIIALGRLARPVHDYWGAATSSFFVVAPPAAFSTTEDWLSRFSKLAASLETRQTIAPNDPLVIRFCRGGCLVVAAWGDEAEALNKLTTDLKL